MYKLHHFNLFHPKKLDRKTRTFAAFLINDFGFMLVSIFIPVFLWLEGYDFSLIALFMLVTFAFRALMTYPATLIIKHYGASTALKIGFASGLLGIGSMVALTSLPAISVPLLLVTAFARGVNDGLYFVARHVNFELITTEQDAGETAGWMRVFEAVVTAIAPLVGGIIAEYFGSTIALAVAFAIIILSLAYVIADSSDRQVLTNVRNKKLSLRDVRYEALANVARGFDVGVSFFVWPLFIYLIVDRIDLVGSVQTISFVLLIPLMIWITKHVDTQSKLFLQFGVIVRTIVFPFRALTNSFLSVTAVNLVADIGDNFTGSSMVQRYYKRADHLNRIKYTYYLEAAFGVGATVAWLIILLLSFVYSTFTVMVLSFLMGALITPWTILYNKVD